MNGTIRRQAIVVALAGAAIACAGGPATVLQQLVESRSLAADLHRQLTAASDAANRAVMAETDDMSIRFVREAEQASETAQKDVDALKPLLAGLRYDDESRLLDEFVARFAEYRKLDRTILELAGENTNLKAQRLSFGQGQAAAEVFGQALEGLSPASAPEAWHVRALAATAIASVREIQVLQAPHIAEGDDAVMTRLESRMSAAESAARRSIDDLSGLVNAGSKPKVAAALAALNQFKTVHTQIIALSRRNSDVRSLALSLGQKREFAAACEDSLRALEGALGKREFTATR